VYGFNSAGFRDIEHEVAKPPQMTRVVVIGDSVTIGYGVNADETFTAHARRLLGAGFELVNIGMSGLNAPQVVHLLAVEGMRYRPDVVVMNFVLNDCDFYTRHKAAIEHTRRKDEEINLLGIKVDPRFKRLLKTSALVYFVNQRMEQLFGEEDVPHGDYVLRIWGMPENRQKISDLF
jgi:lysophospholipase L1-like esterase